MLKYFRGRSLGYIVKFVSVLPLALLLWFVIELGNLFRPVYIVGLSYKGRITQYMVPMELHLRNANQLNKKYTMIFVMPAATPNEAVRTVYGRYSIIIDSHFPNFIRHASAILAVLLKSRFTPELHDWQHLWRLEPATTLTDDELQYGDELRRRLGIPGGAEYVCLGVKEAAYYASITPDKGYGQDLSHQSNDSRNVNINNYLLAATHLANLGIYVVRVGSVVNKPLPKDRHPMIIDYSTSARSELGDITLGANCKFLICGVAGYWAFASMQNRPITFCDIFEMGFKEDFLRQNKFSLSIFRILKEKHKSAYYSCAQIISSGKKLAEDFFLSELGLEPIANTEEEILNAVIEMNDWIDGKLELSEYDEELQSKFYSCYPPETRLEKNSRVRISPSFLRKYEHLL